MTLAELKAWVEETCELSELLQTKDYKSYLPKEKQEEFEAIASTSQRYSGIKTPVPATVPHAGAS